MENYYIENGLDEWNDKSILHLTHYLVFNYWTSEDGLRKMKTNFMEK